MNAPFDPVLDRTRSIADAVQSACARIVPAWPLDRLIAVNPYEGHADQPVAEADARLRWLCATRLTMPRAWYRDAWRAGRITRADLQAAVDHQRSAPGSTHRVDDLLRVLEDDAQDAAATACRMPLATMLCEGPALAGQPARWTDLVVHQVSQHCAACFDDGQAGWHPERDAGLYASWRERIAFDRSLPSRTGRAPLRQLAAALPAEPLAVVAAVADTLCIADADLEEWCEALLLDVGGWAAACAWRRRHLPRAGGPDPLEDLLGIRAGWEWLLLQDDPSLGARLRAARQAAATARVNAGAAADARIDWLLQSALELAYSRPLCEALARTPAAPASAAHDATTPPAVQALFCIDVRSEPFRRALEATDAGIRTFGFAGFFGAPIAHVPLGTDIPSARVPGLLSPALCATQTLAPAGQAPDAGADAALATRRSARLLDALRWSSVRGSAASAFGFVESLGLAYAGKLLKASLPSVAREPRWEDHGLTGSEAARLRLRLAGTPEACCAHAPAGHDEAGGDTQATAADLVERILSILGTIGLRPPLAPLVLIAGHGSQTRNNPHAAGLDCGACGGHTGEVNARLLAGLLNDAAVRDALATRGLEIPAGTWFVAGLHNTTTDEVALFETADAPASHAQAIARLQASLDRAGEAARRARAPSISPALASLEPARLLRELQVRGNDWAQTRPEWGLAGNAAFIAAPRARTLDLDLGGRAFLHDYHWEHDPDLAVLELVMTAPLVVANWINLQYHASTVDPVRYGCGNKLLHNVVGGNIGVFEGNGGDLRIGLPWQSVHDGERFRHEPLRLHAFIDAPAAAIDTILARQAGVRRLVEHGWLHLFRLGATGEPLQRYHDGTWSAAQGTA